MTRIQCPPEMIPHVKQVIAGEYDLPGYPKTDPIILDIGANVGSFAIWALFRWPKAIVYCYEPNPDNFAYLKENLKNIHPDKTYNLSNVAVGDPTKNKLYLGKHNCGECSLYDVGEQQENYIDVLTVDPSTLPPAHILKIDTEGSEIDILKRLDVNGYDAITLEFHSEKDRRKIDKILKKFVAVRGYIRTKDRGVISYLNVNSSL